MLNSAPPEALIYKRTHPGDPDRLGRFGIQDCMGRVRNCRFDIVIGVGGTSGEPCSHRLDRKINWVGRWPRRRTHPHPLARADLVEFAPGDFVVLEHRGPLLQDLSRSLAQRVFGSRNRFLNRKLSVIERREALRVVNLILANPGRYGGNGGGLNGGGCPPRTKPPSTGGCGPRRCPPRKQPPDGRGC